MFKQVKMQQMKIHNDMRNVSMEKRKKNMGRMETIRKLADDNAHKEEFPFGERAQKVKVRKVRIGDIDVPISKALIK